MFVNFVVPRITYLESGWIVVHLQLLIMSKHHELIYLMITVCQWLWPYCYNISAFYIVRDWFVAKCLRARGIRSTPRLVAKWFRPLPDSQTNSKIPPSFCCTNVFTMMQNSQFISFNLYYTANYWTHLMYLLCQLSELTLK